MSLLLDALKKAEQAKKKAAASTGADEKQASASREPIPLATAENATVELAGLEFTREESAPGPEMPEQTSIAKGAASSEEPEALSFPDLTLDLAVREPESATVTANDSPSAASKPEEPGASPDILNLHTPQTSEPPPLSTGSVSPTLSNLGEARHNGLELSLAPPPQGAGGPPIETGPEKKEENTAIPMAEASPSPSLSAPPAALSASQSAAVAPSSPEAKPIIAPAAPSPSSPPSKTEGSGKAKAKQEAQQKTAKNVFSAKLPRPKISPKLLAVALATGVLSVAGLGFYYWTLLSEPQPKPFRRTHPLPPPQVAAPAPAAPVTTNDAAATKPEVTPPQSDVPTSKPAENQSQQPEAPPSAQSASGPTQVFSAPVGNPIKVRRFTHPDRVNPVLLDAYQAYMAGDTARAEKGYRQMLQQDPRNRDALLGLAAIATSQQRSEDAAAYYTQLLELNPKDPEAQTGLINLKGSSDPTQNESRLKTLLNQHPEAGSLHFALGNLYAQQSRWPEAQGAYFKAFSAEPKNADYAFNLAISLDHLNQGQLALKYYQQALTLAASRPAGFDKTQVSDRIQILSQ